MMTDWLTEDGPRLPIYSTTFAKNATGGNADEDSDDDADDDEDDEDDEDEDPDEGKTPEEIRAELKAVRESLSKAGGSVKTKRDTIKSLRRELDEARKPKPAAKPKADGEKPEVDADAIRDEAKREARTEADNRIKRAEAKTALVDAGASRDVAADLIGFVKLDNLDLEGDEVEGLDEEIERIKKKYPAFFTKTRTRRESVAGGGDRDGKDDRRKNLTPSQRQAAMVTGGSRR